MPSASPNDAEMVNIIANYIPLELPQGGPNYNTFGENIRYEIHVKNSGAKPGDRSALTPTTSPTASPLSG